MIIYNLNTVPRFEVAPVVVHTNQGEYGDYWRFRITDGDHPLYMGGDYGNVTVTLNICKADKTIYSAELTLTENDDLAGGTLAVQISQQMTAAAGNAFAELVFEDGDGLKKATANFVIAVERSPLQMDGVESASLIGYVEGNREAAERATAAANAAAEEVEGLVDRAETAAASAQAAVNSAAATVEAAISATVQGYMQRAETAAQQALQLTDIPTYKPTMKCLGIRGQVGQRSAQSVDFHGGKIWAYLPGVTGIIMEVDPADGTTTMHTLDTAIDKGNGMAWDGSYFYLTGTGYMLYKVSPSDWTVAASVQLADQTLTLYGLAYGTVDSDVGNAFYGYYMSSDSNGKYIQIRRLNVSTGAATDVCKCYFDEADTFGQDMCIFDGNFYLMGDYPGKVVKIAPDGTLMRCFELPEYCDNGIYTGEVEGIIPYDDDRLLVVSGFTQYIRSELAYDFPNYDSASVALRRKRTIVFSLLDVHTDISGYTRERRGALATQTVVRWVDAETDHWLPDGSQQKPYPSLAVACCVQMNDRHIYTIRVVHAETDNNDKPQILLMNLKSVRIILTSTVGDCDLYLYGSDITLSAASTFTVKYLVDSEVRYFSAPEFCLGVEHYNDGYSRFNARYTMLSPFGDQNKTPDGEYTYYRTGSTPKVHPRKVFNLSVVAGDTTYKGSGFSTSQAFQILVMSSTGAQAVARFTYSSSSGLCSLERVITTDGTVYTSFGSASAVNVNMAQ